MKVNHNSDIKQVYKGHRYAVNIKKSEKVYFIWSHNSHFPPIQQSNFGEKEESSVNQSNIQSN